MQAQLTVSVHDAWCFPIDFGSGCGVTRSSLIIKFIEDLFTVNKTLRARSIAFEEWARVGGGAGVTAAERGRKMESERKGRRREGRRKGRTEK